MKWKTPILIFLLLLAINGSTHSQSVYHFQYKLNASKDPVTYHSLFVRFDDGTGFLRVRYTAPSSGETVVAEMDAEEQYVPDKTGKTDSSRLLFKGVNPRIIIGEAKQSYDPPAFLFQYNPATDFLEPAGVRSTTATAETGYDVFTFAKLIPARDLSKKLVLQFFTEDEEFYVELFKPRTRGLTQAEKSIRLHLLVVGDTLDKLIGPACNKDIKRTVETFEGLTSYLGIKIITKVLSGKTFSPKEVLGAIEKIRPAKNDIVVFYFSGHGFRKTEDKHFPWMKLKTNHTNRQDVFTHSLNIEDIFLSIKSKGARFNLVMSDCCNDDITSTNSIGTRIGKVKGSVLAWNEDNCKALFMNKTPMSVLVTAADNGQRAACNNTFGSFFSYFFKSSMENHFSLLKKDVTWDQVINKAKEQTTKKANHTYCPLPNNPTNICHQEPYYIIR